jgi:hypothetical protein
MESAWLSDLEKNIENNRKSGRQEQINKRRKLKKKKSKKWRKWKRRS